jgi:KipI family sensor histidine kinase inhibitor
MTILPVGESALLVELPDAPGHRGRPSHAGAAGHAGRHARADLPGGAATAPAPGAASAGRSRVAASGAVGTVTPIELYRALTASAPSWVIDLVPAAATVLVTFDRRRVAGPSVREWIARALQTAVATAPTDVSDAAEVEIVEIPVRYDGADLVTVADLTGSSVEEVIDAHTEQLWTAAFIGFAPGFAYLQGEDDRLSVPRRATPRPVVPAGSVALAAGYCGVYPRESPGGWQLVGSTTATLWDARRAEPALLVPGSLVRFVRVP